MKQIFDWMRDRVEDNSYEVTAPYKAISRNTTMEIINEAEAKLEADCCEWTPNKYVGRMCYTSCGYANSYNTIEDKYCRHCGKPIKILEVE